MKLKTEVNEDNNTQNKEIEQAWIAEAKYRIDLYRKGEICTVTEEEVFSFIY